MPATNNSLFRKGNNFDFIRLLAALMVLVGHSSNVLLNRHLDPDPGKIIFGFSIQSLGVLIFFIISGFLVTRSFENKNTLTAFFSGRVLRIFPALIIVVLLSVFILGPLVTTASMSDYFSSPLTFRYLQDMTLYRMYYYLPGVFNTNLIGNSVNASLWTLPYEFTCYLYVSLAGFVTLLNNKWFSLALFLIYFMLNIFLQDEINKVVIPVLGIDFKTFFLPFLFFLAGSLMYTFRNFIQYNISGLIVCMFAILAMQSGFLHRQFSVIIYPYLVLSLAFSRKLKFYDFARYGDFSYGMYLYAFPVQQLLILLLPFKPSLMAMILLSVICTFPFAFLSWRYIEAPALSLKKHVSGKQFIFK